MKDEAVHPITVFTAGFSGKSAQDFFELLKRAGVCKVIDIRLYNTSQLAGYTKRNDLAYFVRTLLGADYVHLPKLAPTKQILNDFKQGVIDWPQYETAFNELIAARRIEAVVQPQKIENACFLCAEAKPAHCHRRLVAEYLAKHWPGVEIVHL